MRIQNSQLSNKSVASSTIYPILRSTQPKLRMLDAPKLKHKLVGTAAMQQAPANKYKMDYVSTQTKLAASYADTEPSWMDRSSLSPKIKVKINYNRSTSSQLTSTPSHQQPNSNKKRPEGVSPTGSRTLTDHNRPTEAEGKPMDPRDRIQLAPYLHKDSLGWRVTHNKTLQRTLHKKVYFAVPGKALAAANGAGRSGDRLRELGGTPNGREGVSQPDTKHRKLLRPRENEIDPVENRSRFRVVDTSADKITTRDISVDPKAQHKKMRFVAVPVMPQDKRGIILVEDVDQDHNESGSPQQGESVPWMRNRIIDRHKNKLSGLISKSVGAPSPKPISLQLGFSAKQRPYQMPRGWEGCSDGDFSAAISEEPSSIFIKENTESRDCEVGTMMS